MESENTYTLSNPLSVDGNYKDVLKIAKEYGYEVQDLIDLLIRLGIVQSVISRINDYVTISERVNSISVGMSALSDNLHIKTHLSIPKNLLRCPTHLKNAKKNGKPTRK